MRHGRGDDVGMLRLVLSRLAPSDSLSMTGLMGRLYAALKGRSSTVAPLTRSIANFALCGATRGSPPRRAKAGLVGGPGPAAQGKFLSLSLPGTYSLSRLAGTRKRTGLLSDVPGGTACKSAFSARRSSFSRASA
jgi:hypothetical protein